MTTPEPPGEPTPPSFEKPATGGSPYGNPPQYPTPTPYPATPPTPVASPTGGGDPYGGRPYYSSAGDPAGAVRPAMPPLGGLGTRLVARIIDWVILLVAGGVIATAVVLSSSIGNYYIVTVTVLFAGLIGFVYEGLMLGRAGGQTLGKKAMRIRVAMLADGTVPPPGAAWMRSAVFWVPVILSGFCLPAVFSLVDILWCTWDRPYRQCLHDKAARTVVVRAD